MFIARSSIRFSCGAGVSRRWLQHPLLSSSEVREHYEGFICDLDGVLYHGESLLPGAAEFVEFLQRSNKRFLFLTNSSERTPRELSRKLARISDGKIDVPPEHFYTSALATAEFVHSQCPNATAYVIGEPGLLSAVAKAGIQVNTCGTDVDFVIVGETQSYALPSIELATKLVCNGARLIGTNADVRDKTPDSFKPACAALIKPIEMASGRAAHFVGKPSPLIMRAALGELGVEPHKCCIVGDNMQTDIQAGVDADITSVLVLSGVTRAEDVENYAFRPHLIVNSVADLLSHNDEHEHHKVVAAKPSNKQLGVHALTHDDDDHSATDRSFMGLARREALDEAACVALEHEHVTPF